MNPMELPGGKPVQDNIGSGPEKKKPFWKSTLGGLLLVIAYFIVANASHFSKITATEEDSQLTHTDSDKYELHSCGTTNAVCIYKNPNPFDSSAKAGVFKILLGGSVSRGGHEQSSFYIFLAYWITQNDYNDPIVAGNEMYVSFANDTVTWVLASTDDATFKGNAHRRSPVLLKTEQHTYYVLPDGGLEYLTTHPVKSIIIGTSRQTTLAFDVRQEDAELLRRRSETLYNHLYAIPVSAGRPAQTDQ